MRGAYGRDDVANSLAGCGRVGLVVDERGVGGVVSDPVEAVGRQSRQVLLCPLLPCVVSGVGGEDDERLTVKAGQGRRLLRRSGALAKLLDEAGEVAGGRGVGACLVPGAWWKSAVGERVEQASAPRWAMAGNNAETRSTTLLDSVLVGWAGPGLGAVESSSTMPAT